MPVRTSHADWEGNLRDGNGSMAVGDGAYEGEYTYVSRFEEDEDGKTNPEELIGAAHAGCFSMKLAGDLHSAGYEPQTVHTSAHVHLEDGAITRIVLEAEAEVPDIGEDEFMEIAQGSKEECPVSQALSGGPEIELQATLV